MRKNSIIWFQHLHKCAGSSVVELARLNGEVFCPNNANGNPCDAEGNHLPIWEYSPKELTDFLDNLEAEGVTFVACEQGSPVYETLFEDERITTISGLRSPEKRFVSAYKHHYCRGGGMVPREMVDFWRVQPQHVWNYENYFTRIFSGAGRDLRDMTAEDLSLAKEVLSRFDKVYRVDSENWLADLADGIGWEVSELPESKNVNRNFRLAMKALLKGDFNQALRRALVQKSLSGDSLEKFKLMNHCDIHLFDSGLDDATDAN